MSWFLTSKSDAVRNETFNQYRPVLRHLSGPVGMTCSPCSDDTMVHAYDRLAPVYDALHRRWLRFAGGEAQAALEAAVRVAMTPKATLLDAGCGTGRFARALLAEGVAPWQVTLLDPSDAMLGRCSDIPVLRMRGRLEALPFQDASFDAVTCAWALETVPRPDDALHELCRVLRPGGILCLTFCADKPARGLVDRLMRFSLELRGTGTFLKSEAIVGTLRDKPGFGVQAVPCAGPVATLIVRRWAPVRAGALTRAQTWASLQSNCARILSGHEDRK